MDQEEESEMDEYTSVYDYPAPIANPEMKPSNRILVAEAVAADLTDEERTRLEPWVPEVLAKARDKSPKQVFDALRRVDYLRLEAFRASIADQAFATWKSHLDEDEQRALITPLPARPNLDAKRRLLEVIRYIRRLDILDHRHAANTASKQTPADEAINAPPRRRITATRPARRLRSVS